MFQRLWLYLLRYGLFLGLYIVITFIFNEEEGFFLLLSIELLLKDIFSCFKFLLFLVLLLLSLFFSLLIILFILTFLTSFLIFFLFLKLILLIQTEISIKLDFPIKILELELPFILLKINEKIFIY